MGRRVRESRCGDLECYQKTSICPSEVWKNYQRELSAKHGCNVKVLLLCGSNMIEKFGTAEYNKTGRWTFEEVG